jgi:hypothetical protein
MTITLFSLYIKKISRANCKRKCILANFNIRKTKYKFIYIYKKNRVYENCCDVHKIINNHLLQTGMQLYLILSCDDYSIGHHTQGVLVVD